MKRTMVSIITGLIVPVVFASSLQSGLDRLINQVDPNINMGISIIDLNTGEHIYQRQANQPFTPASNMKLFSNAAALIALGPDFQFISRLSTSAKSLQNGTLYGSIYLELPGDPSFTRANLNALLSELKTWHIKKIHGNIILVNPYKTASSYAPGIMKKDIPFSYGAPISPLIVDENRLTITVNPAGSPDKLAIVEYDAPKGSFPIHNSIKTVASTKHCGLSFLMDENNNLSLQGCIGVHQQAYQQRTSIRNPILYTQALIKHQLSHLSIELDGQILLGNKPSNTLLLAKHTSKPLTALLSATLKPSDNLYADRLYLQTASHLQGSPIEWSHAPDLIKAFLAHETHIDLTNAALIDGSGLSHQDKVTPAQTVQLLQYLATRFPLAYEYISALPIAGEDGTLRKRLTKPFQRGFIRAKTGTMAGIISLSGYLYTANAHTLVFAIYINTRKGTPPSISGKYRHLVDTLCDFMLHQKPNAQAVSQQLNIHTPIAYQHHKTQTEQARYQFMRWRQLELALKNSLKQEPVTVLFKPQRLILIDNTTNSRTIWTLLQSLATSHSFSVALQSKDAPNYSASTPFLLWVNSQNKNNNHRTWTLTRN